MGGIILLHPGDAQDIQDADEFVHLDDRKLMETIVDIDMLKEVVKNPDFKIGITEEEINDKAKGDFLSKTIAFFQVSWFITQCIARFVQNLGVTQLEVVTLALASMNLLMYFFWSSKPLGLQVPVRMRYGRRIIVENKGTDNGVSHLLYPLAPPNNHLQRLLRGLLSDFDPFRDVDVLTSFCIVFLCILLSPLLVIVLLIHSLLGCHSHRCPPTCRHARTGFLLSKNAVRQCHLLLPDFPHLRLHFWCPPLSGVEFHISHTSGKEYLARCIVDHRFRAYRRDLALGVGSVHKIRRRM
jgi:hypothetical protein